MPGVKELQIKCLKCLKWFSVHIFFNELGERDPSWLNGKNTMCKHCMRVTGCYKENIRIKEKDACPCDIEI